jgi:hypothetical protein
MITIKLNCSRIDKTALFEGKNGKYLDLVLFENKGGRDQYGNDGFVTQDIGKERREAGEKGPILGNYKEVESSTAKQKMHGSDAHDTAKANAYQPQVDSEMDDVPF